ncbi:Beta-1,4-galactosyltransferase 1 [Collichthys lucidus]|uniref:Beta-1,4-galactosyltransferase n=1 Tax=Collichthys lucidus TaxID=240159 RepID=A0A4U5UXA5_COLLU|nr:Beta-1,4-galactosyltransferase 1 [Collichthys lucidus]
MFFTWSFIRLFSYYFRSFLLLALCMLLRKWKRKTYLKMNQWKRKTYLEINLLFLFILCNCSTLTVPLTLQNSPLHCLNFVGASALTYKYSMELQELMAKLAELYERGRYKPPDCIAQQKVAIIIAFRNRHEHLKHWLYYLHPILERQQLDYGVYIINQDGEGVFNRAKLMNVGFVEALKEYDYDCLVFSDIDLVPMDDRNLYRCFQNPRHLSVAIDKFNFQLPYGTNFGGVISLSKSQFLKINGFSNTFWGWGGEDDDIYQRVIFHGMSISRPDLVKGKYKMIKHVRDLHNEQNPVNAGKLRHTKSTMNKDGINSLKYTVKETVKDILYTWITVDIQAPLTT